MALTISSCGALAGAADDVIYREQAEMIYSFTNYIHWPGGAPVTEKFVITVVGESPLLRQLKAIAPQKTVNGRKVEVRAAASVAQLGASDVVVVGSRNAGVLQKVLRRTKGQATLVISDAEGFATLGAGVNFFVEAGRLRFEINRAALEGVGLRPGSRLLRFARVLE